MKRTPGVMLAVVATLTSGYAAAQSGYPTKPVRVIVNFATGGPADIVARMISMKLTESWGKPVVVENIAGGAGNIGAERAAKATPDGYTMLVSGGSPIVVNPLLREKLAFNSVRDLAPITQICTIPNLLLIHPALPAKNVEEFIVLAKGRPGHFTYASSGSGTASHLGGELFKTRAGIDIRHIPYKGTGATIPDLIAGRVSMTIAPMSTFLPLVRDGKLRVIAVAAKNRSSAMPEVPTVAESGYPGFDTSSWQGVFVPAQTPAALVRRLNQDLAKVIAMPDVRARFGELGMEPVGNTPRELATIIQSDVVRWTKVINDSGAKAE